MRAFALSLALTLCACLLPACTSSAPVPASDPAPQAAAPAPAATPATGASTPRPAAPVASTPAAPARKPTLSNERVDTPRAVLVNRSCRTDADCTIKDVGSCCGTYPACVNVDSPADPRAVQLECARKGMASTCEVPVIESCTCNAGQCAASSAALR